MTVPFVVSGIGTLTPPAGSPAGAEDWFDYRTELGRHGYKYLPTASKYVLAATKRALADAGPGLDPTDAERRGAVVGTNSAASALHADMDRTVLASDANDLSPALAPFFSINLFGGRLAIEHQLKGFNLTLTSTRVAGFEAAQHGIRSARLGRASWLIASAVETALDNDEPGADTSESGAVALVLEPETTVAQRGGRSYGRLVVWTAFLPPSQAEHRAADLIRTARRTLGVPDGASVRAVLDGSPVGSALDRALDDSAVRVPARAGCLEPMVQVAGALTEPAESIVDGVLVLTAAAEGNVAFALITK